MSHGIGTRGVTACYDESIVRGRVAEMQAECDGILHRLRGTADKPIGQTQDCDDDGIRPLRTHACTQGVPQLLCQIS